VVIEQGQALGRVLLAMCSVKQMILRIFGPELVW